MVKTNFKWKINTMPKTDDKNLPIMSIEEVEKAKKLLEQAKERMGRLPDRDASPAEQNAMTINMLI